MGYFCGWTNNSAAVCLFCSWVVDQFSLQLHLYLKIQVDIINWNQLYLITPGYYFMSVIKVFSWCFSNILTFNVEATFSDNWMQNPIRWGNKTITSKSSEVAWNTNIISCSAGRERKWRKWVFLLQDLAALRQPRLSLKFKPVRMRWEEIAIFGSGLDF